MIPTLAVLSQALRTALFAGGVVLAAVAALDWAVRTRRITPFGGVSRFVRSRVDPRLAGIERLVLRSGGHGSTTPWWGLLAYVVLALLILALVDLVVGLVADATVAASAGPAGLLWLAVHWTFGFLILALLVRVISSWIPALARSRWARWSHPATEWMLRPLRQLLPAVGPLDVSPIVAYFGLTFVRYLVETVLRRVIQ